MENLPLIYSSAPWSGLILFSMQPVLAHGMWGGVGGALFVMTALWLTILEFTTLYSHTVNDYTIEPKYFLISVCTLGSYIACANLPVNNVLLRNFSVEGFYVWLILVKSFGVLVCLLDTKWK